jgi:hypothetical protein
MSEIGKKHRQPAANMQAEIGFPSVFRLSEPKKPTAMKLYHIGAPPRCFAAKNSFISRCKCLLLGFTEGEKVSAPTWTANPPHCEIPRLELSLFA